MIDQMGARGIVGGFEEVSQDKFLLQAVARVTNVRPKLN